MTTLARQGYDLIIGVGYAQGDAIATAAKKFPNTKFAIVDVDQATLKGKPANVQGLLFREEQVGYLAGYLAALEAKRAGGNADQRRRRLQGAAGRPLHRRATRPARRRPCPGIDGEVGVLAGLGRPGEVQGAGAEPDRRRLEGRLPGRRRLRARGAARREAAEGVGHRRRRRPVVPRAARADERAQGRRQRRLPDGKAVQDGTFAGGGNATFGLDQDGVGLGTFSPKADKADIEATKKIEQQIADGDDHGHPDDGRVAGAMRAGVQPLRLDPGAPTLSGRAHRVHGRQVRRPPAPRSRRRRPSRTPRPRWRRSRARGRRRRLPSRTPRGARSGTRRARAGRCRAASSSRPRRASPRRARRHRASSGPRRRSAGSRRRCRDRPGRRRSGSRSRTAGRCRRRRRSSSRRRRRSGRRRRGTA